MYRMSFNEISGALLGYRLPTTWALSSFRNELGDTRWGGREGNKE